MEIPKELKNRLEYAMKIGWLGKLLDNKLITPIEFEKIKKHLMEKHQIKGE